MATDIVIPTVGESVTSGVIAAWSKAEGEWVERDETVLELETDKITMEVPAPAAGVIKHAAAEGDEVDVGAVVGTIDETAAKPAGAAAAAPAQAEAGASAAAAPAPAAAVAAPPAAPATPADPAERAREMNGAATTTPPGEVRATPLARKLAQENGIDLKTVIGTGPSGRIREQDVLAAIRVPAGSGATPVAPAGPSRNISRKKMTPLRQKVASRLVEAQQTAAMLTTFNEVDMKPVMDLRKRHKEEFAETHGVGLGFMSFFVKASVSALKTFPMINSYIVANDDGAPAIESHDYQDIAIAVSSPKGLVVPVLRDCDQMSFADVEGTIKDFGKRAQDGKLGIDEMQGGTFTITNGGVFGSLLSTPILNPPQSAILGMHGIKNRAVEFPEKSGQIALRPMMYLALSYDHRIVDGAEAVRFLVHIKNAIENPERLLLAL
ncbi:MAG: 2-oxoglutarate dehydrogenase complex dihydrolipoyllysine-residue succinyltransferase [Planctomycetota bacterium]